MESRLACLARRDFLRGLSAASVAALGLDEVRASEAIQHPAPTADTLILLWMAGGMAAPETFDPKRYTPFEVGVPAEKILCTFPSIPTARTLCAGHQAAAAPLGVLIHLT